MARGTKSAKAPVDQSGRSLGPRARKTRERLLEATRDLLAERGLRDLSVVEIARAVDASPATFYQYFKDVPEAVLRLAEEANGDVPALVALVERSWSGAEGLEAGRALVEGFIRHWDEHHAVLRVRNLASEEGDRRFQRVRRDFMKPLLDALSGKVEEAQRADRIARSIHPYAAAAAMASMLERLAAFHREIRAFGASQEDLVETCARILIQTATGESSP